jgi:hypothetical protein
MAQLVLQIALLAIILIPQQINVCNAIRLAIHVMALPLQIASVAQQEV